MRKTRSYIIIATITILLLITQIQIWVNNYNKSPIKKLKDVYSWAYQLQNADPKQISKTKFDLVVIDYSRDGTEEHKYTKEEIETIKGSGKIPIAYISIGEAEDYRFYWRSEWNQNPPPWLGRENPEWEGNYAVKYWDQEWKKIIFEYIDKILEQGFQGLYLDKIDEFEYWSDPENTEDTYLPENETAKRMIKFILEIANYCRSKMGENFYIIPQNGERILDYDDGSLVEAIDGWGVEDLFYNETIPNETEYILERTKYLDKLTKKGKIILSVDYVDDGSGYIGENKKRINDYIKKAREKGYIPYVAKKDRALDELNIINNIQPPNSPKNHGIAKNVKRKICYSFINKAPIKANTATPQRPNIAKMEPIKVYNLFGLKTPK